MNTIVELVLRVAGLVEAEGRVARRAAVRIVIAGCIWALGTILMAAGLLAVALAIFLALAEVVHPAAALLVVALIVIAGAVACALGGRSLVRRPAAKLVNTEPRTHPQPLPQM